MKYYNYSVKNVLESYFGNNTVFEMRKPHEFSFSNEEEKDLLPLLWRYADEQAAGHFLWEHYLLDTIPEDDYIAYIVQFGDKKIAYLLFMVTEDEPYFHIDINYAKQIVSAWESKGYSSYILRVCIGVEHYRENKDRAFHFVTHSRPGHDAAIYEIRKVNDADILVFSTLSCWEYYYQKLIFLSETCDRREYECLFEPDVKITKGEENSIKTISAGIDEVMALLHKARVCVSYTEFEDTETYSCTLISAGKELGVSVNDRNLICEVNVGKSVNPQIIDRSNNSYGSMLAAVPQLISVSKPDPVKMHGYALQLEYSNGAVRNYYLKCFEEKEIPRKCKIDNFVFTMEDFLSAESDSYGNITFKNGYSIPGHHLYYRSYRQASIVYDDTVVCKKNGIVIQSLYRLPLIEFKGFFITGRYLGWPDECFGPNMPWTDRAGKRTSDIALFSADAENHVIGAAKVCVEPTGKYGFLKEDGTWLVPPIYDDIDKFSANTVKATRKIDGADTTVLITEDGIEKSFPFDFDAESFSGGLCPFNAEEWNGPRPDPG
ncbi:MAG: WG repeat-containing protein, partial [Clostridia bacterium]|nr:WG repeat-containing protein [Clostridia bacterium]